MIGGNIASSNAWPWLVNILDKSDSRQYCSGAIVDQQWILTAAHCFIYHENKSAITFPFTNYTYIVADHTYNVTDPYEFTVEPLQLFVHPKYIPGDGAQPGMLPHSTKIFKNFMKNIMIV